MEVKLLTTPKHLAAMEFNAAYAMLTCHANTEKLNDEAPRPFIEKAIKAGHESILEHITLTYEITNLSRACLQELARHRHISLSVERTRHTLKSKLDKIINDDESIKIFVPMNVSFTDKDFTRDILPFAMPNFPETMTEFQVRLLAALAESSDPEMSNDELKYYLPEWWPTNLVMTANIRELRHIVRLRTSPAALGEFQVLARAFVSELPYSFKYLLEDCVYKENNKCNAEKA